MDSHISASAGERLKAGGSFRKLVWLHSAAPIGVSAVLILLTALSRQIAPEGGLSNMDTHTRITTVLTLLQLAATVGMLFWNAGLEYTALGFLRGHKVGASSLAAGFSRFLPVLTSWIFRWGNYLLLTMVSGTLSSILFSLLPMPSFMYEDLMAFATAPSLPLKETVMVVMAVYVVIYLIVLAVLLVPRFYRHRLTGYCIMDDQPTGGLRAVLQSTVLMRGNRWKLAKLDLRFWWFYLGELMISGLALGELFFPEVPGCSWLFPLLALAAQLVLYLLAKPKLALCYGLFYESILNQPQSVETPAPVQTSQY